MLDHASDCAVHDAPAYEPGQCDCGLEDTPEGQRIHEAPPTKEFWVYEGGHHWALMRGARTIGQLSAISPSVNGAAQVDKMRRQLAEIAANLNTLVENL